MHLYDVLLLSCRHQYRDQRERPDLANPETLQLFQDTRFEQLRVSLSCLI